MLTHHHYGVSVRDLEASVAWYERVLGFAVERRFALPLPGSRAAMLRLDDLRVELFEIPGSQPLPPERRDPHGDLAVIGNKHPAYRVADLAALLDHFHRAQVDVAFTVPANLGRACFVRDPDGNLIEFVERRD
jgi:catechol 2,3-dioxygenase-like lactoylglutathione lyase family enzyme